MSPETASSIQAWASIASTLVAVTSLVVSGVVLWKSRKSEQEFADLLRALIMVIGAASPHGVDATLKAFKHRYTGKTKIFEE